jgi:hypothetical protein
MFATLILAVDRNECSASIGEGAPIVSYETGCRVLPDVGVTRDISTLLLASGSV